MWASGSQGGYSGNLRCKETVVKMVNDTNLGVDHVLARNP